MGPEQRLEPLICHRVADLVEGQLRLDTALAVLDEDGAESSGARRRPALSDLVRPALVAHLAALRPEHSASTNSATSPFRMPIFIGLYFLKTSTLAYQKT